MSYQDRKVAAAEFRRHIAHSNALHAEYLEDPALLESYQRFTVWQLAYLSSFFDDLRDREGYGDAIDFVMTDLAGIGISARDRDLERVAPTISALMPRKALETLASAAEANARVLEINLGIFRCLLVRKQLPRTITEASYCQACRAASTIEECMDLVGVVAVLGKTLDLLVRSPLLGMTLRAMRAPAHAAGFGALHEFLETGYSTFTRIPDIDEFLSELEVRTGRVFERIYTMPLKQLA